ncbi:methyltransferase [Methylocystis bryophila]|uniref:Methyltransferase n=2 Tax=Methylocystis bryophila TaxID=655015 RepID=A0A1W6MTJ8_9HYPH|nr:methyltransferase [Methylocystis bryophila]
MATRISGFLGGRLQLAQDERGHRVGLDAALLAAATPAAVSGLILDLGAGVGAVGLSAALLAPRARIGLVEIAPAAAALARENIRLNRLEERARVFEADFVDAANRRASGLVYEEADVVLTNPPHHAKGRVRASPDPARALAHVAAVPLADWTRAALALLAPGGSFAMIHRAEALAECLAAMGTKLGGVAILPVSPRDGAAATRVLIRGVKGSKAPLSILPPLILHHSDGAYAPLADAILRGLRPAPL